MNCCFTTLFTSASITYRPNFYARIFPSVRWLCNIQLQIHIKSMFCVNFISFLIILLLVQAMEFFSSPPHTYCLWCSTSLLSNRYWKATVWSKHSFHPRGKIKEVFQIHTPYIPPQWMMVWHRDSSPSTHLYIHLASSTNKPVLSMWRVFTFNKSYILNSVHLKSSINKAALSMWWIFTFNKSYKLNSIK
jgi:hypothetical protein